MTSLAFSGIARMGANSRRIDPYHPLQALIASSRHYARSTVVRPFQLTVLTIVSRILHQVNLGCNKFFRFWIQSVTFYCR